MLGWSLNLGFAGSGAMAPTGPHRSALQDRRWRGLWWLALLPYLNG